MRFGPYEVVAEIGRGATARVFRARHVVLGRDVALKVVPLHSWQPGETQARHDRFLREARTLALLSHPNVATVHEATIQDGRGVLVMELVLGESLRARLARTGPVPERDALELLLGIARGVAHAHEHGVVHRDLKPDNVIVTTGGVPKVVDFGLARGEEDARLTESGAVVGTMLYLAPELARAEPATPRSDVWALGVILYECLAGRPPFKGRTMHELLGRILAEVPPAPGAGRGADIALCALSKDPAARPADGAAFAADLARALGSDGARPERRVRPGALVAALVLLVLAAAGGLLALRSHAATERVLASEKLLLEADGLVDRAASSALIRDKIAEARRTAGSEHVLVAGGKLLARARLYSDARALLEQAIQDFPPGYEALDALHEVCHGEGSPCAPVRARIVRLSKERGEENVYSLVAEADTAFLEKDYPRCISICMRADRLSRNHALVRQLLAWSYRWLGEWDLAVPAFTRVLEMVDEPAFHVARAFCARMRHGSKDLDLALRDCDRVLAADPRNTDALVERAQVALALGHGDEGLKDAVSACEASPGHVEVWLLRAAICESLGHTEEQRVACERGLAIEPGSVRLLCLQGGALAALSRNEEALASFTRALALAPKDKIALTNRGRLYAILGNHTDALADLNAACAVDPDYPYALYFRGRLLFALGDKDRALVDLRRARLLYDKAALRKPDDLETLLSMLEGS